MGGGLHRRKNVASHIIDMVWLYRSSIPVGRKGVYYLFILRLPAFAVPREEGGGGVSTLWGGVFGCNNKILTGVHICIARLLVNCLFSYVSALLCLVQRERSAKGGGVLSSVQRPFSYQDL